MEPIASDNLNPTAASRPATSAKLPAQRKRRRRWLWIAIPLTVIILFYGALGYFGSGLLIGEKTRWRGMNRGPQDFGLASETVSFDATDGVPIKA